MALSIPSVTTASSVRQPLAVAPPSTTSGAGSPGAATEGVVGQFGRMLDGLTTAQNTADGLAVRAASGDLSSIQALTMASTEAQLLTQLTVTIRNRALEAFRDVMGMQV